MRSVVGECCSSGLWRHCCQKCLRICGSGFRRERKRKMVCTAIVRPYRYMGRYCPKEGKNRRKVNDFLFSCLKCYLYLLKFWIAMTFVCWPRRTREKRVYAREMSLTRAYRAHTNSDLIFLLSQVSHKEGKGEEKDGETQ